MGSRGPYWSGPRDADGELAWLDVWDDDETPPYCARCLVHVDGWQVAANGTAKWSEFAQYDNAGELGPTWAAMPSHMLGKVAEAMALRRGFPEVAAAVVAASAGELDLDDAATVAEAAAGIPPPTPEVEAPTDGQLRLIATLAEGLGLDVALVGGRPLDELSAAERAPGDRRAQRRGAPARRRVMTWEDVHTARDAALDATAAHVLLVIATHTDSTLAARVAEHRDDRRRDPSRPLDGPRGARAYRGGGRREDRTPRRPRVPLHVPEQPAAAELDHHPSRKTRPAPGPVRLPDPSGKPRDPSGSRTYPSGSRTHKEKEDPNRDGDELAEGDLAERMRRSCAAAPPRRELAR